MSNTFISHQKSCHLRDHKEKYGRARQAMLYGGEKNKREQKLIFMPGLLNKYVHCSGIPRNFFQGGFNKFSLGTEGREWGLGAVTPLSGVLLYLQMCETHFIRLLRIYFLQNWEFGSALSKLQNFRG
jgi:hypothetical protein